MGINEYRKELFICIRQFCFYFNFQNNLVSLIQKYYYLVYSNVQRDFLEVYLKEYYFLIVVFDLVDRSQFVIMNIKLLFFLVVILCVFFIDVCSILCQNIDVVEGNLCKGV